MIKKILVGYDGSDPADHAFDFALELAGKYGAELHVVAVARPPEFGTEVETAAYIEQARHQSTQVLHLLKERVKQRSVHFKVAVGHPAEQIVLYAENNGADHIVVGHRSRVVFERWLIGSTARLVIAHAHCGVTVIR